MAILINDLVRHAPIMQHDETALSKRIKSPEGRLLTAIIERTVRDLYLFARKPPRRKYSRAAAIAFDETFRTNPFNYVRNDSKGDWSIYWVLSHLSGDPNGLLQTLRKLADHIEATGGKRDHIWERAAKVQGPSISDF